MKEYYMRKQKSASQNSRFFKDLNYPAITSLERGPW